MEKQSDKIVAIFNWNYCFLDEKLSPIPQFDTQSKMAFMTRENDVLCIDANIAHRDPYYDAYNIGDYGIRSGLDVEFMLGKMIVQKGFISFMDIKPSKQGRTELLPVTGSIPLIPHPELKEITAHYKIVEDKKIQKLAGLHVEIPVEYYNEWVAMSAIWYKQITGGFQPI